MENINVHNLSKVPNWSGKNLTRKQPCFRLHCSCFIFFFAVLNWPALSLGTSDAPTTYIRRECNLKLLFPPLHSDSTVSTPAVSWSTFNRRLNHRAVIYRNFNSFRMMDYAFPCLIPISLQISSTINRRLSSIRFRTVRILFEA